MLETGIKGRQDITVTTELSAKSMGSGGLEVFATPAMIALMEKTAMLSVQEQLDEGQGTVGTRLEIDHVAATPVGAEVWCESELVEIDRKRLVFEVIAYDKAGVIGKGRHERFIVNNERFMEKAKAKL
ncbi:MAG: thioesterase family protein [Ruminiclostridium sp.]